MTDLEQRVAKLEEHVLLQDKKFDKLIEAFDKHMKREDERWEQVVANTSRNKGFFGGVVFIISAMWASILAGLHLIGGK